jgi:amidase
MKTVQRQHNHPLMDATRTPVLRVQPGEEVLIETQDACYGRVRSVEDFYRYRADPQRKTDPLTGPIFVEGARPGGALVVEILDIQLDETGFQLIGPNRAIIRDEVPDWDCYVVRVQDGMIRLPRGLELPAAPMIGTLGNSPAGEPTLQPGRRGGNLDCPQICVGARVYLPIEVEGAMFYLGDVHARQGDGEVVGAPEIGARVTVRFGVEEKYPVDWPLVEDDDCWHVVASAPTEEEAIRQGVFAAARFIEQRHAISFNDALILLTMSVTLRCSRTGGWHILNRVVSTSFSKSLIAQATARASRL